MKLGKELERYQIFKITSALLQMASRVYLGEVCKNFPLVLVMPAPNCTSEGLLTSTMYLHVHKERTGALDLTDTGDNFVGTSELFPWTLRKFK